MQSDNTHYQDEREFWEKKGEIEYISLSDFDQRRLKKWIAWTGHGRALDVGGGSGMISRILAGEANTECVCIDISHNLLRHSPVPSVQTDALRLPFGDETFDLIVAAAFFHHIPGREKAMLDECFRVLKPGGRLVGYDPNAHSIPNKIFMRGGPLRLKLFSPDERPIYPRLLDQQAKAIGFTDWSSYNFSFKNPKITAFEFIQRYILSPIAIGPLEPFLDRWFFWSATK